MRKLILSVSIIVVLVFATAAVIYSFGKTTDCTIVRTIDADLQYLESALEQYKKIGGHNPTQEQGLLVLFKKPIEEPLPARWIQMLEQAPTDPWGTPYQYHFPGKQIPEKPEMISAGFDQKFGTDDDFSSQD